MARRAYFLNEFRNDCKYYYYYSRAASEFLWFYFSRLFFFFFMRFLDNNYYLIFFSRASDVYTKTRGKKKNNKKNILRHYIYPSRTKNGIRAFFFQWDFIDFYWLVNELHCCPCYFQTNIDFRLNHETLRFQMTRSNRISKTKSTVTVLLFGCSHFYRLFKETAFVPDVPIKRNSLPKITLRCWRPERDFRS